MFRDSNLSCVILCMSVYSLSLTLIYQSTYEASKRSINYNETTLLVIAHPDDEAMFFGPTIIRKLDRSNSDDKLDDKLDESNSNFYLLCITQGNQHGIGDLRKHELLISATKLGIKKENIKIMDDIRWLDGENHIWHKQSLKDLLIDEILSKNITELITFDEYGVSGHSNHQTIYKVVRSISLKINFIKFYTLKSINLVQKYLAFFDYPIFYLFTQSKSNQIYMLNLDEYLRLIDAFHSHQSQLVWFRRLYSFFSKYMYVNVLEELQV